MKQMPVGVKIIAVLFYIGAVLSIVYGILLLAGSGGMYTYNGSAVSAGALVGIGVVMLAVGVLEFFIGWGLWKGQRWARIVGIILSILAFIGGIISLIYGSVTSLITLVIAAIIGGYLWFSDEVQKAFM